MKKKYIITVLILVAFFTKINSQENYIFSGKFTDLQGVMNHINCVCSFSGYLNDTLPICFDLLDFPNITTGSIIKISGNYQNKNIEATNDNPCPSGDYKIFMVTSFNILSDEVDIVIPLTTIEGFYTNKKNDKNDIITCYCLNCGYLKTKKRETFAICLDNFKEDFVLEENKKIKLTGYFETYEIDNYAPCSAGKMEIFIVTDIEE